MLKYNKRKIILLLLNILIIGVSVLGLFQKGPVTDIKTSEFVNYAGYPNAENTTLTIDDSIDYSGICFYTPEIPLNKGVYQVIINYDVDKENNQIIFASNSADYQDLKADTITLYPWEKTVTNRIWLSGNARDIIIKCNYNGEGRFTIEGITIVPLKNYGSFLFKVLLLLGLDLLIFYLSKQTHSPKKQEKKQTMLILGAIITLASLPLAEPYLIDGHDLMFHLMRIEGIKEGLLSGQFPVYIQPNWLYGYGYDVSVFYPDFFLYVPAILALLRIPIIDCFKIYVFLINIITVVLSYISFYKITKNRIAAYLSSFLYACSTYRLMCLYRRAAIGEFTAMTVLPLLLYAFYKIYTEEISGKNYKYNWILPVIGFSALIQSHVLSCEMAGIFTVISCLILWKKTFRKETFMVCAKIVVITVILNIGFFVPFLQYSRLDLNVFHDWGELYSIQNAGLGLLHLFSVFSGSGEFYGPGIACFIAVGMYLYYISEKQNYLKDIFLQKSNAETAELHKFILFLGAMGCFAAFMATKYFPYDWFMRFGKVYDVISKVQFPFRYLTIAVPFLALFCGVFYVLLKKENTTTVGRMLIGLSIIFMLMGNSYFYITRNYEDSNKVIAYDAAGLDSMYIEGHEYMYVSADMKNFTYKGIQADSELVLNSYEKKYNKINISCVNPTEGEKQITVPLYYWPGYEGKDVLSNEALKVCPSEDMLVQIWIPAQYSEEITLQFIIPSIWKAANILSGVVLLLLIGVILKKRKTM